MALQFVDLPNPVWTPLENDVGTDNCVDWMYMGCYQQGCDRIYTYKHRDTRVTVAFGDDGRRMSYVPNANGGSYVLI